MSRHMTKPTKWPVRPVKTLISLCIRPVWSVFTVRMTTPWVLSYPRMQSEDWSDWVDAQTDLSLRWAHMPFCWFCHEAAQYCIMPKWSFWVVLFNHISILAMFIFSLQIFSPPNALNLLTQRNTKRDENHTQTCGTSPYTLTDSNIRAGRSSSIGSVFAWHASGSEFDPHLWHILSWRLGHENISTAILPLPMIQEEQLLVTGKRMCTKYW